ncbi:lipase family protein [Gordonia sp. VNK1]|uniref:lipase family protein n=1 Tax=Gordonia oleivorans TaxID=3156618 RepID=UPI0032B410BA
MAVGAALIPGPAHAAPDPFYATSPPAPDARLGSIVRIEPTSGAGIAEKVPGTRSYRLLYVTTGPRGGRTTASGSFFIPPDTMTASTPDGHRSLIGIGISDESMGAYCRPTTTLTRDSVLDRAVGIAPVNSTVASLRAGHAVFVADLASDGVAPAPTLLPRFDGHSMLDGLRAALQIPGSGLTASSTIGIFGPSGGGSQAAAVSAEQAATYAPELHIPAIVIGQMVPDHRNFIRANDGGVGSGFALADLLGLEVGHPEMRIDEKLTPVGRGIAEVFRSGCATPTYMTLGGVPLSALFLPGHSPYDDPDFQPAFAAAALATPTSPTPTAALRMTRCDSNVSPIAVTPVDDLRRAVDTYRAAGVEVSDRVAACLGGPRDIYAADLPWLLARV